MSAVAPALLKTIRELQQLDGFGNFALGGGTNLALRYNHRLSVDIDLFSNEIIGFKGFQEIAKEVTPYYGSSLVGIDYPCNNDDQYIFLRFLVKQEDAFIKVEVMQNFQRLDEFQIIDGYKLLTTKDIGLLKLISASNRATKKDIYDLDLITDIIPLEELFDQLKLKQNQFSGKQYRTIFDLDNEESPIERPELLIQFDTIKKTSGSRPSHSQDLIQIVEGNKTWCEARYSWLRKIRSLFKALDLDYPKPKGYDL